MDNDFQMDKGELGENFVNQIAFRSFLKYWCFPSPRDILKDNKEICDLLILFDNVCMIVSVKNYEFKGDYERFFRKTINKAIKQIDGAERKLFRDGALLIKHPDRKEELFIKENFSLVYRIIVNLNTSVKYYQTSYSKNGNYYTVLDATAWHSAMKELNTLPDITKYLTARCNLFSEHPALIFPRSEYDISTNDKISAQSHIEDFFSNGGEKLTIVSGSELDLIAEYILSGYRFSTNLNHDEFNGLYMKLDGRWNTYQLKIGTEKAHFEKESYFIDRLVREFLINTDNGNHLATMFFRLNRFQRAEFAREFLKYHESYVMGNPNVRLNRTHFVHPYINMVFICHDDDYPKDQLTAIMEASLHHHHYLHRFNCKEVGALAMSKINEDLAFGYSKLSEKYTEQEVEDMKNSFKKLGWQLEQLI